MLVPVNEQGKDEDKRGDSRHQDDSGAETQKPEVM